jgi:N-methylhydantoinase A
MSAIGLLAAPLSFEVFKADRIRLDVLTGEIYDLRWHDLLVQARAELSREPKLGESEIVRKHLDMRYRGQGYELEVSLPEDARVFNLRALFEAAYSSIFGKAFPDQAIEITNWKLALSLSHEAQGQPVRLSQSVSGRARKGARSAWDPESQSLTDWPVFDRAGLIPGDQIDGPALIEESESTCVIGLGDLLTVDAQSNLIVSIGPTRTPS